MAALGWLLNLDFAATAGGGVSPPAASSVSPGFGSGGRGYGRITSDADARRGQAYIDKLKSEFARKAYIADHEPDHIAEVIEARKDYIADLEKRQARMETLASATKDANKAAMQALRLERLNKRLAQQRAMLDDELALLVIIQAIA